MKNKTLFYLSAIVLFALLWIVYSNHFHNGFHFDDSHTIQKNTYIYNTSNIPLFFKDAKTFSTLPSNQSYRPLVSTSLAIDYKLGGGFKTENGEIKPNIWFHLSTFLWYIFQCVLMFFIFLHIMNISLKHVWNPFIALFATGWYALHTANAETINYIISRSDVLSTVAVVASMFMYIFLPKLRKFYLYMIPAIIGMFAKETTSVFIVFLFAYIFLFEENRSLSDFFKIRHLKITWKTIVKILPVAIIFSLLMYFIIKHIPATFTAATNSKFSYLITQPFVIVHYFNTFFLPMNLSADTDWKPLTNIFDDRVLVGTTFLIFLIVVAFFTSRKKELRPVTFGIIWFLVALLPTSSIIPLSEVMNDHRIFFPYIGLTLSVVWMLGYLIIKNEKIIRKKSIYKIVISLFVIIVIAGNSYGVYRRNKVWLNEETLWYDVTIKSPENGRGLMNYGLTQMRKGKYDIALACFEKALIYNPYYTYLHTNLGIVKNVLGRTVEAEDHFKKAIQYGPNFNEAYFFYAQFLYQHNRKAEAVPYLEKAVELSPASLDARYLLMELYSDQSEWDKLKSIADGTLQINPNDTTALNYIEATKTRKSKLQINEEFAKSNPTPENYLNLSLTYFQYEKYDKCIEACNEALKLRPNYADAYNNICSAYNAMKRWDEAIKAGEKALQINPKYELARNNLNYAKSMKK